ncbi:flagellar hook assembly protein FlgD [Aquabacterium humicola]|uniref:flagellar hook assembly protein FlgD n=1 Tax=Aquabacterium humicola TaxID=3237377 RepID=UPI0025427CD6|nr:flagellar hook assembly protein FlgD [Rubrivivax pictus]
MSTVDTSNSTSAALGAATSPTGKTQSASEQSDRFLKLLVTQMQNQDPLNPMDNAQITTQMAQISTVSGIDELNKSIVSMSAMLMQTQQLQAASLIGKNVLVPGNKLAVDASGNARGAFELAEGADAVTVQVKNANGLVLDTISLGPQDAGRLNFNWKAPANASGLTFTVNAKAAGVPVTATPLVVDTVRAVYNDGGQLNVELQGAGVMPFRDVKGIS